MYHTMTFIFDTSVHTVYLHVSCQEFIDAFKSSTLDIVIFIILPLKKLQALNYISTDCNLAGLLL